MNRHTELILSALPLAVLATLAVWVCAYQPGDARHLSVNDPYIRHFIRQSLFERHGGDPTQHVQIDRSLLQPGDLLFGHHPGGSYGHWTHCSIYLGDGQCSQQNLYDGMYTGSVSDFMSGYQAVSIKRASLSDKQRRQVCDFVHQQSGSIFDMAARKHDPRLWNCAKLCWAAYASVDVDLCPASDYILPDFLIDNEQLYPVATYTSEIHDAAAR